MVDAAAFPLSETGVADDGQGDGLYFPSPVVDCPTVGELSYIQARHILIALGFGTDGLSEIGVPEGDARSALGKSVL